VGFLFQEKYENVTQENGELKELLLLLKVEHDIQSIFTQFVPHQINA